MSSINEDTKTNIDRYIADNPHCKLIQKSRTETLEGEPVIIQGYKLPRDLVYYNADNGRFASEIAPLIKKNGGKALNPLNKNDAKKIQQLLLDMTPEDTRKTYVHLQKHGQTNLALITQDGTLIDGNRRMAVISQLHTDKHDDKYNYIEVALLDRPISKSDLWAIEAGISMGADPKVRYGPINEIKKLKQGIENGFSPEEIANLLYGGDVDDIKQKLAKLEVMEDYLDEYYGGSDDFTPLKGHDTHFSEYMDNQKMIEQKGKDLLVEEIEAIRDVSFRMIREDLYHRRLRFIRDAVKKGIDFSKLVDAADEMEPFDPTSTTKTSPTQVRYTDFEDLVSAQNKADNVIVLLNTIANNFSVLDVNDQRLKSDESKHKIKQIKSNMEKLLSAVDL
jgi:hypothetical protein